MDVPQALPQPHEVNWFFEALKILATSALTVGGVIVIGLWQHREKYIEERIGELIKEVDAAADAAIDYWSCCKPACGKKFRAVVVHDNVKDRALEADLVSRTLRIGRMRATVGEYLGSTRMKALFEKEGELFEALTGGEFQSSDRILEPNRFTEIRSQAAYYVGLVRLARHDRLSLPWYRRILN